MVNLKTAVNRSFAVNRGFTVNHHQILQKESPEAAQISSCRPQGLEVDPRSAQNSVPVRRHVKLS